METTSVDVRGYRASTLVVFSLGAAAYCVLCGVAILGTVPGNRDRMGFVLDNAEGQAKLALTRWREGVAMVNGPELLAMRSRLIDIAREGGREARS